MAFLRTFPRVIVAAAATIARCAALPALGALPVLAARPAPGAMPMPAMPMPGGAMSMAWLPMPGRSWAGTAASFLALWVVMMAAMMLPSLLAKLLRRPPPGAPGAPGGPRAAGRAARAGLVGAGYFAVWTALGAAVFPLGAALAAAQLRFPPLARASPLAAGLLVLLAGAIQCSGWKARRLARWRAAGEREAPPAEARAAWHYGLRLGLRCAGGCANLMAVLLALGIMDLRAMAGVAAAVTLERLGPAGATTARAIGALVIGLGAVLLAQAARLA